MSTSTPTRTSRLHLPPTFFDFLKNPSLTQIVLNSLTITLSCTLFLLFLLGSYSYFNNVESNKCGMTYMFEYPEYIKIPLKMDNKYPKYGLYAYGEGKFVENLIKHKFTGIPVLFVPGNAGSYQQVRSLASIALMKYLDSKTPFHFDFFSIDFNEELSGLYGYVLNGQSLYLSAALEKIQSFYQEYHQVVLIGHSMGGIITKALKDYGEPYSNLIISLSTPHSRPIFVFDPEQDLFYYHLSRNWTLSGDKLKKEVNLISIWGGDRDFIVPEGWTKWGKHLSIHTTTTGIPGVWASTDHLCIVWCKQFVLAVVRMLYDLVEYRQPNGYYAISQDMEERKKILEYHLIKKTSGKSYHGGHRNLEIDKPPGALWNELLVHNYCQSRSRSTVYLMFPMLTVQEKIKGDPNNYKILILTTNTEPKNWVYGCTSQSFANNIRYCSAVENLSKEGELIPHFKRRRKVIHLKYSDVAKYSHLVVKMDPMNVKSCVNLEVYNEKERNDLLNAKFETQGKIFYNLSLPLSTGVFGKLFAWNVIASTENGTCEGTHNSLAAFKQGNFRVFRYPRNETLLARFSDWNATSGHVELYLEPKCKYTVQVRLASLETAGQVFRTYLRFIPSFFGSIVLMSLYFQKNGKDWMNFHRVLLSNSYYLTIVPGLIVSILLTIIPNDWPHMMDGPEYFIVLPVFCYLVAYAMVVLVAAGGYYLVIVSGNAVHAVFLRMLSTRFAGWTNLRMPMPDQVADMALDFTFAKFPVLISVFLISMTLATCGGFGLLAGMCFFVIKLFKLYEDLLGDLWRVRIRDVAEGLSPLNFQFCCSMLWFLLLAFNFPSLLHWVKSFSYEGGGQWDISMYLCLMALPTFAILWQDYVPNFNPSLWLLHRFVFYGMGLGMVLWGTFRLYIAGFIVTVVLLTTAMCQLISSIPLVKSQEEAATETVESHFEAEGASTEDEEESSEAQPEDEDEVELPDLELSEKSYEKLQHENIEILTLTKQAKLEENSSSESEEDEDLEIIQDEDYEDQASIERGLSLEDEYEPHSIETSSRSLSRPLTMSEAQVQENVEQKDNTNAANMNPSPDPELDNILRRRRRNVRSTSPTRSRSPPSPSSEKDNLLDPKPAA